MANRISIKNQNVKRLTLSALMLALAVFLDLMSKLLFPFLSLSFGGSITIASMLPIILIGYLFGVRWGLLTGFAYSLLQMVLGMSTVSALFLPGSDSYTNIVNALLICLIDYVLAYTSLGLGGIFRNKFKSPTASLVLGSVVSLAVCYGFHVLSGAIFYGACAEWFFTDTVMAELAISSKILSTFSGASLAIIYSIIYNGCYMIPEIVITSVVAVPISRAKVFFKK